MAISKRLDYESPESKYSSWEFWIEKFLRFGAMLGILPYAWDKAEQELIVTKSKMKIFIWYFGTGCLILDNMYLLVTAASINYSGTSSGEILKFLVHTVSRVGASCGSLSIFLRLNFNKDFLNYSMKTHRLFKGQFLLWTRHFKNIVWWSHGHRSYAKR